MTAKASEQPTIIECLYIIDDETSFLAEELVNRNKLTLGKKIQNLVVTCNEDLDLIINHSFNVKNVIILVELYWDSPVSLLTGYSVADKILCSANRLDLFNLVFISTLKRRILLNLNTGRLNVLTRMFPHHHISKDFDLLKLEFSQFNERKFRYIVNYCFTESGMLDLMEHDLRPYIFGIKVLNLSEEKELVAKIIRIKDILGKDIIEMVNETVEGELQEILPKLHKEILKRRELLQPEREKRVYDQEKWKPEMLIVDDDQEFSDKLIDYFANDFKVTVKQHGSDALALLKERGNLLNTLICDMELLDDEGCAQPVHGIEVVECAKEYYPHLVTKIVTHLPKLGLKELMGADLNLRHSDLIHKSMFQSYNIDYIKDLILEIKREIDVGVIFQRLKGPSNTLWGNISRQEGPSGRLKQFYYMLRNDPERRGEFNQLWDEVDEKIKSVLEDKGKINSHFPQVSKRNKVEGMALPKVLGYLKELLINRQFWIRKLYNGQQEEHLNFKDYKRHFENGFLLFSTDKKRFNQYSSLTGFSISQSSGDYKHKLRFNQFLEEELFRIRESKKELPFDLSNSYLVDTIYDLLLIISRSGSLAFKKSNYPQPQEFWDADNQLPLIKAILEQLTKETSSKELISSPESREEVLVLLKDMKALDEFKSYSDEIKRLINMSMTHFTRP